MAAATSPRRPLALIDSVHWCRVGPSGGRPFEYTLRLDHPAWWNEYEQRAGVRTGTPAEDFEIG
jgi:hypothetical protein